jgi:hypothetical protein
MVAAERREELTRGRGDAETRRKELEMLKMLGFASCGLEHIVIES